MIEQVLEEITIAEKKAAEIRLAADEYATRKNKEAEEKCDSILKEAEASIKELKKERKQATAIKVEKLYAEVLLVAKNDADALYSSLSQKINKLSDEIVGKVINGNC